MEFETIDYRVENAVAWVTMNRPDVYNAFNRTMQAELRHIWRTLRYDDSVRCVVLTGAGSKAFSTGLDRGDIPAADDTPPEGAETMLGSTPFHFDDPGDWIGPKSNDLWKPVIAAVNGMACGGAFYLLGEVDFIIAADHATFFDPHVTYGMCAPYEPIHMLQKMPFGEVMRMTLLGNHERLSAQRAHQIGMVSEVVGADELTDAVRWAAEAVASAPSHAVQATVRSVWAALEMNRRQALNMGWAFVGIGNTDEAMREGQEFFSSGRRIEWRSR